MVEKERIQTMPNSKRHRIETCTSVNASVSSVSTQCSTSARKAVEEIRSIMNNLDHDKVQRHFIEEEEEIEPFVVCDGVSVEVYNQYADDGESLPIALRFLDLDDKGRLLIVEYPISAVHESSTREFESEFIASFGNRRAIAKCGSMTVHRGGNRDKEADATFGPKNNTPNATPPPAPRTMNDWITLAVEVGRSQTWVSLERAARWWYGYTGIQYILLLKVGPKGQSMRYRLYDVIANPMRRRGYLPATPHQEGHFRRNRNGPVENITFDNRRILSIPAGLPLPVGVNAFSVVNLRDVMDVVILSLPRS